MLKKIAGIICMVILSGFVNQQTENWINITKTGAPKDGKTLVTGIIQSAIEEASIKGGTIYFPDGEYLTGPIILKSNINLFIDAGAILHFSDNYLPFVEMPVTDVTFPNVNIEVLVGMEITRASRNGLRDINIPVANGSVIAMSDVKDVILDNVSQVLNFGANISQTAVSIIP